MLLLDANERERLWKRLAEIAENYIETIPSRHVAPKLDPERIRDLLKPFDFTSARDPIESLEFVAAALTEFSTHTPHPRYFGLFNPAPTTMGAAADFLVAIFNPQLAAWSHSPFAVEVENHLCRALGARFGYEPGSTCGIFCSGGAEANHTAVLAALAHRFPEFRERGIRSLIGQPTLYVSREAHHSFLKAARLCGLGTDAVREIPVDERWSMDVGELEIEIARDFSAGNIPFLIVATAGTTNEGAIDPVREISEVAQAARAWLHVDAAWGGAAALDPALRWCLDGVERADSITFDAHKWLSAPMGAGMFLTRHMQILEQAFRVDTAYMPHEAAGLPVLDPYQHSMQWSRRFTGLKVFLSLAVAGWEGYASAIRHMVEMGRRLKAGLKAGGWRIVNDTPLPIVCFTDAAHLEGARRDYLEAVARTVVASGHVWISSTVLGGEKPALRACITNYRTEPQDVDALLSELEKARASLRAAS